MKVMLLLFFSVMIILLIIAVNRLKKIKLKKKKELFTRTIRECVKSYEEKKDFWAMLHDTYCSEVIFSEKDELLKKLPQVKEQYKNAVKELVQISNNNTVLFSSEDEWDNFDKNTDLLQREKKISDDIIKTLLYLSDFIEMHKLLVLDIYAYVDKITTWYELIWAGLTYYDYENEENLIFRERKKIRVESCKKLLIEAFSEYVQEDGWKIICQTNPRYNSPADYELFVKICEEDEEVYANWMQVWYSCWKQAADSKGYVSLYTKLHDYLNGIAEEFGNPAWLGYPTLKFSLSEYSSFSLGDIDQIDSRELSRICNLYIQGKMSGKYYQSNDPKYAK